MVSTKQSTTKMRMYVGKLMEHSTRRMALADPANHVFIKGKGYVRYTVPLRNTPLHTCPPDLCEPPVTSPSQSWHALQPPGRAAPIHFQWLPGKKTWFRPQHLYPDAKRMGFTAEYLSKVGWTYIGPVTGMH